MLRRQLHLNREDIQSSKNRLATALMAFSLLFLPACNEARARDQGIIDAKMGTPTPAAEYVDEYQIVANNLYRVGSVENDRVYYLGSGGLIDGTLVGRPDVTLLVSARHVGDSDNETQEFENEFEGNGLILFNGIKKIVCIVEPNKFSVVPDSSYDVMVIAFSKSDAITNSPEFFQLSPVDVNPNWEGTGEILAAGYGNSYMSGLGREMPAITILTPLNKQDPERNYFYHSNQDGQGASSSGGLAMNNREQIVGLLVGLNQIRDYVIAPLRNFYQLANEAISALK